MRSRRASCSSRRRPMARGAGGLRPVDRPSSAGASIAGPGMVQAARGVAREGFAGRSAGG